MSRDAQSPDTEKRKPNERALFFNTATLARFLKVNYGAEAVQEAERHISKYTRATHFELADIWRRVLAHLRGVEVKDDHRRVVKSTRSLKVKL